MFLSLALVSLTYSFKFRESAALYFLIICTTPERVQTCQQSYQPMWKKRCFNRFCLRIRKLGSCLEPQNQRGIQGSITTKQYLIGIELCRPSMQLNYISISDERKWIVAKVSRINVHSFIQKNTTTMSLYT